jgi:hypothetical protein
MTRKVAAARGSTKSSRFRNRKPNCTTGNPISPVVAVVKAILSAANDKKPAWELHILTGAGLSTCQKVLSGHRAENLEMFLALLRSPHGWDVLQAAMEGAPQPWFDELANLDDIAQMKRDQLRMKRDLDRREQRLLEARAQP